jgi:hypothetical protein
VLGCLLGRLRDDWNIEAPTDHLGDFLEGHAFLGDRMEGASLGATLQREPVDSRGVAPMHRRPAVVACSHTAPRKGLHFPPPWQEPWNISVRGFAVDLAPQRINGVCPGLTLTELIPRVPGRIKATTAGPPAAGRVSRRSGYGLYPFDAERLP